MRGAVLVDPAEGVADRNMNGFRGEGVADDGNLHHWLRWRHWGSNGLRRALGLRSRLLGGLGSAAAQQHKQGNHQEVSRGHSQKKGAALYKPTAQVSPVLSRNYFPTVSFPKG